MYALAKTVRGKTTTQDVLAAITRFRSCIAATVGLVGDRATDFDRNLLADDFWYTAGYRIGNLFAYSFHIFDAFGVVYRLADRVRHPLYAFLFNDVTASVGDLLGACLRHHAADLVAAGLDALLGHHLTDLVAAGSRLGDHAADLVAAGLRSCFAYVFYTIDCPLLNFRHPNLLADPDRWALGLDHFAATRFVAASAAAGIPDPFPG